MTYQYIISSAGVQNERAPRVAPANVAPPRSAGADYCPIDNIAVVGLTDRVRKHRDEHVSQTRGLRDGRRWKRKY